MVTLTEHYERLLGLDGDWQVLDVELVLEEQRVAIQLEPVAGASFSCSGCGRSARLKIMRSSGSGVIWTRCSLNGDEG